MFRLIKLAMMALFGYAVYEFFRGVSQSQGGLMGGGEGGGSPARQADQSRGGIITDLSDTGLQARTEDAAGASMTHRVGRGAGF